MSCEQSFHVLVEVVDAFAVENDILDDRHTDDWRDGIDRYDSDA